MAASSRPLLILDTNILVDVWLARNGARSDKLDEGADRIQGGARIIATRLDELAETIDEVDKQVRAVAQVEEHTLDLHFRGDLRFLSGRPPDRPVDGIKDCRIYEAILDIATADQDTERPRILVTRDSDFDHEDLRSELQDLGVVIRKDPGRLYGELRA